MIPYSICNNPLDVMANSLTETTIETTQRIHSDNLQHTKIVEKIYNGASRFPSQNRHVLQK